MSRAANNGQWPVNYRPFICFLSHLSLIFTDKYTCLVWESMSFKKQLKYVYDVSTLEKL